MFDHTAIAPISVKAEVVRFDYESVEQEHRPMIESRTSSIKERIRKTAQNIVEIGEMLIDVKERLPHGQFVLWLQIEFNWDIRSAQRFMAVAAMFKNDTVSHFSKDLLNKASIDQSALYILAAKSTPQQIRHEILERAYLGEPFTKAKVKQIVSDSKTQIKRTTSPKTKTKREPPLVIGHWVRIQTKGGNKNWDRKIGQIVAEPDCGASFWGEASPQNVAYKYGVKLNETTERCLRFYKEELTAVPCPPGQLITMSYPGRAGRENTQYNGYWAIVEDITDTGNLQINLAGVTKIVMKTDIELADNPPSDYTEIVLKISHLLKAENLDVLDKITLVNLLQQPTFTEVQQRRLEQIWNDYNVNH